MKINSLYYSLKEKPYVWSFNDTLKSYDKYNTFESVLDCVEDAKQAAKNFVFSVDYIYVGKLIEVPLNAVVSNLGDAVIRAAKDQAVNSKYMMFDWLDWNDIRYVDRKDFNRLIDKLFENWVRDIGQLFVAHDVTDERKVILDDWKIVEEQRRS